MARSKSELLSNMGNWFNIIKALADAVLRAGGDDKVLRQVENPAIADEVATMLMARIAKPAPIIRGRQLTWGRGG